MSEVPCCEPDPYRGLVIADAVRLEELIGVGTTGRVYRARQLALDRTCAVKILHRFLLQTRGTKERFHREARLLARLVHPGIVQVLDSGQLPDAPPATHAETYLVYEYLEGQTLREVIAARGALPQSEALSVLRQLASSLAVAHARKVIHRDLKPENVMSIARDNDETRYVVLDFGLARALDAEGDPLTREGAIVGTPQYMSPEAARGEPATPASDVYGLAVILYELLSGRPPFHEGSPLFIMTQQACGEPPRFAAELGINGDIQAFVLNNLSKATDQRCQDAQSFGLELEALSLRHQSVVTA